MGRRAGSHNADFEATRVGLLIRVGARLLAPDGAGASLRELATAAGVGVTTLKHYFPDRDALIAAYLKHCHDQGREYLLLVATHPLQADAAASLRWTLDLIRIGLEQGPLLQMHALGLRAGLDSPQLGPAYLSTLLEPTLACVEVRIERHQARGELQGHSPRLLALQLVSPLLLALLHQRGLCGAELRPLDPRALVDALIAALPPAAAPGPCSPAAADTTGRASP